MLSSIHSSPDKTIAVFVGGAVGMSAIMAAKIANYAKIIAVGENPKSLALAKELCANHTVNHKEVSDLLGQSVILQTVE